MSEIQPQDRLELLREPLLADERRDISEVREKLALLEAEFAKSADRSLLDLLREQKRRGSDEYQRCIAALQDATEGAIERSVHTNKARLAGALFPIMGPAIRSYVAEMFRGLAEDLNNSLQNATSLERIRWRFQARLSGKPFSEYVALKTANFRVEELYLIEKGTGLLVQRVTADPDHETPNDPDLMSGMLTAIRSFTRDVFGEDLDGDGETDDDQELDRFSFAGRQVLIEGSPTLVLAAVVRGTPAAVVREKMRTVLEALHEKYAVVEEGGSQATTAQALQAADGAERREILDAALLEATSSRGEPSAGSAMWRAWALLTIAALAMMAWIGWRIWDGKRWQRFADQLRSQPGMEVISADGPRVSGLRDPYAVDPMSLAPDPDRAELVFAPFHSLHPEFVERREAAQRTALGDVQRQAETAAARMLALEEQAQSSRQGMDSLRNELAVARKQLTGELAGAEALRRRQVEELLTSRFAGLDGLSWRFSADGVEVGGGAPEPYYTQILQQLAAIDSLGRVDTSELVNLSGVTLEGLLEGFSRTRVLHGSGSTNELGVDDTIKHLAKMIGQLDEIATRQGRAYQFRIRSHPLISDKRDADRVIEQQRAEALRRSLIDAGIAEDRLTFELSEDNEQKGRGVEIVPDIVEP